MTIGDLFSIIKRHWFVAAILSAISGLIFIKETSALFIWVASFFGYAGTPAQIVLGPDSVITSRLEIEIAKHARSQNTDGLNQICVEFGNSDKNICAEVDALIRVIEDKKLGEFDSQAAVAACDLEARRPPVTDLLAPNLGNEEKQDSDNLAATGGQHFQDLDPRKTIDACSKAVKLNPKLGRMHYQLALGYLAERKFSLAAASFEWAIKVKYYKAHRELGYLYGGGKLGASDVVRAFKEF